MKRETTSDHEDMRNPGLSDEGMSTVEYALGTLAAAAFAAVLMKILTGDAVADRVAQIIDRALTTAF